jgi:hypothetical protein
LEELAFFTLCDEAQKFGELTGSGASWGKFGYQIHASSALEMLSLRFAGNVLIE